MSLQPSNRRQTLKTLSAIGATSALAPLGNLAHAQKPVTVGVIYVGPRDDYGYNQAQAQAAAEIKKLPGVKVVEEENVPETAAVQKTMTGMISQDGASVLFPTSFGYFDPHLLALAAKFPDVRFAHCGGMWTEGKHPKNAGSFFGYIDECQYRGQAYSPSATQYQCLLVGRPLRQACHHLQCDFHR
jgi:basic membrane protein A and related proteins